LYKEVYLFIIYIPLLHILFVLIDKYSVFEQYKMKENKQSL